MKKLLGSTLALAMFLPAGANAELFKNLKVSGQLDVQTTSARNVSDFVTRPNSTGATANNDRIGDAHTRLMVRGDWDLLDDVHARVTLVKGGGAVADSRVYGEAADDLNTIQTQTFVQEAFVKIDKLFGHVDTTMGRQFYGESGDLIIYYGPRDSFGQRVSAIDAFRADWNGEHMQVTGIAGRTTDAGVLTAGAAADVDVRGLTVSCNKHENVKPAVYLYNRVTHGTAGLGTTLGATGGAAGNGKNDQLWVAGFKVKGEGAGFSGSLEFAKNFGQDRLTYSGVATGPQSVNYTGHAIKLNAGYKADVQDVAVFNPWLEAARGSGDNNSSYAGNRNFQSIATDYRPGAIYGRFDGANSVVALGGGIANNGYTVASAGLSNRLIWGVGIKATPAALNKLTTGVQFYRFAFDRLPEDGAGIAGNAGRKVVRFSRNIGSEIDWVNEWKHSENVMVKVTLGTFQPGAFVRDLKGPHAAVNPAVMAAGDVSIKF